MAATSGWFDKNVYLSNKLAQLQAADPEGQLNGGRPWTSIIEVEGAFASSGLSPEQHFIQYGAKEGLSPNAYFNVAEYYAAKAAQLNGMNNGAGHGDLGNNWTAADVQVFFYQNGLSPWEHYASFGFKEGLAPSSLFDASKYYAAKAEALNAAGMTDGGGRAWTANSVQTLFEDSDINPLVHYLEYRGTGPAEVSLTVDVAGDKGSIPGDLFTLTTGRDVFVGTDDDDTFNAPFEVHPQTGKATVPTFDASDAIDGGNGHDTLNADLTGAVVAETLGIVRNVEKVNLTLDNAARADLSSWTGLENLTVTQLGGTAQERYDQYWTVDGAKSVSVRGGSTVTIRDGGHTLTTVAVDNALSEVNVYGNAVSSLNLSGMNSLVTVTAGAGTRTLHLALSKSEQGLMVTDKTATDVVVSASGKAFDVGGLRFDSAETMTLQAEEGLTILNMEASALHTLNITGAAPVSIIGLSTPSLEQINAESAEGGVELVSLLGATVAFSGSSGSDSLMLGDGYAKLLDMGAGNDQVLLSGDMASSATVKLGSGDDMLVVGSRQTSQAAFDGGKGIDTIQFNETSYVPGTYEGRLFTHFETLRVSAQRADKDFNTSFIASIQNYEVAASSYNITLSDVINNSTTRILGSVANGKSLHVDLDTDTANDSHTVILDSGTDTSGLSLGGAMGGGLIVDHLEHLHFVSTGASGTAHTVSSLRFDLFLQDITISGDHDLTLETFAKPITEGTLLIDGHEATGNLTINAGVANSTKGINIIGGSGNDELTAGVAGGRLTGGLGKDTLHLEHTGGRVVLVYETAQDSLLSARDVVTGFSISEDKIDLSAFDLADKSMLNVNKVFLDTSAQDFFSASGVVFNQHDSILYVDADSNGAFNADKDLAITLQGVASPLNADTILYN